MQPDFEHMMHWLSNEVVQGLAFSAGSTFDPPNELKPWHVQPDLSLGVGAIPLDKSKFPTIAAKQLADKNPSAMLPSIVTIPDLALHVRLGLPGRFDLTIRGADTTVPKGYRLTPGTTANGQSNSIGFGLRKHFFGSRGDEMPLISVAANYNHVKGYFNYLSGWERMDLMGNGTLLADTKETGRLEWNVNSFGVNTVMSQTYGIFTPFVGAGWNYTTGSMSSRLEMHCASIAVCTPTVGEASDHPEQHHVRLLLGGQLDGSYVSFFANAEIKAIGQNAARTLMVTIGVVSPFRIGSGAFLAKGTRALTPAGSMAKEEPWEGDDSEPAYIQGGSADKAKARRAKKATPRKAGETGQPAAKPSTTDVREEKSKRPSRKTIDALPAPVIIQ